MFLHLSVILFTRGLPHNPPGQTGTHPTGMHSCLTYVDTQADTQTGSDFLIYIRHLSCSISKAFCSLGHKHSCNLSAIY